MLLNLMYHKVGEGKYANPLQTFAQQFAYLHEHKNIVLPGDPLAKGSNICLTFDDATVDFYHHIFPLLQQYELKALLAIPVDFIEKPLHCNWEQICEMERSGLVQIASHSYSHRDLTQPGVDLKKEIIYSKRTLEDKLSAPVSTFVFPYGRWSSKLQKKVIEEYSFAMRIGSACNFSWDELLYRIPCDNLSHPLSPFSTGKYGKYIRNFFLNKIRLR